MKPIDLLLLVCAIGLVTAGFLTAPALGCLAVSVSAGAGWYLLDEADE